MTTSLLLKYARARDDSDFVWRISAACAVRAQEQEFWEVSPESRKLIDYVLANPMAPVPAMVNHLSTSPAIAANVSVENRTVDTSAVPDDDIQYVVNEKWDTVAKSMFPGVAAPTPAAEAPVA